MEEQIYRILKEKGQTLTTAESCTGGLLAGRIINVSGASEIYREGFITYSNEAKMKYLGVSEETLAVHGAVSRACAEEMARGAAEAAGADAAIATTGIAGPDGGTEEKPVGLVYIGIFYKGKVTAEREQFEGDRQTVRNAAVARALELFLRVLGDKN